MTMNYLIAFDKFKSAVTAEQACEVARTALQATNPVASIATSPLTDGGEGFASVIASALGGQLRKIEVKGPLFAPVEGRFTLVEVGKIPESALHRLAVGDLDPRDTVAFVEMASASGYEHLSDEERDPWETTTYGTGELLKIAASEGVKAIVLGIGGSATNDCGAGALEAMGVAYYDRELQQITRITPAKFRLINTLGSTSHLVDAFPPVRIACDVTNPLLGETGATRVFGPQKGLQPEDLDRMELSMRKMGSRLLGLFGKNPADWDAFMAEPGSGAAGGIGFALRHALPDSKFVEGFPLVAEILSLRDNIFRADVIITGEGRFDASSLSGKGPYSLIESAGPDKQVQLLCGSADQSVVGKLTASYPHLVVKVISSKEAPLDQSIRDTPANLSNAIRELN